MQRRIQQSDPIGFLAPVTVTAKIILWKILASKYDPLPDEVQGEWLKFRDVRSLSRVVNIA